MSLLDANILKARDRLDFDLDREREFWRTHQPSARADAQDKTARLDFLSDSLGSRFIAESALERVLAGNELQEVNYLLRGSVVAHAIGRVHLYRPDGRTTRGFGTGFLITPNVLLTNNHVLENRDQAQAATVEFEYELDIEDEERTKVVFPLEPDRLFLTNQALDFSIVAVAEAPIGGGGKRLADYGCLPLLGNAGKAMEGEWLTIIQHPGGERKQVCVRENRLMKRTDDVLWYSTDTLGGSSGSPVFNNDWYVVALHHSGVPETKGGRVQTVDGVDYQPDMDETRIKWKANEGIRASRIVSELRAKLESHPLLQPMWDIEPAKVRAAQASLLSQWVREVPQSEPFPNPTPHPLPSNPESHDPMNTRIIDLKIEIDEHDQVRLLTGGPAGREYLATAEEAARKTKAKSVPSFDVPFNATYDDRKGFNVGFLGAAANHVHLPELSPALRQASAKLIDPVKGNDNVLHYHNFSVVMHEKRRFAIYSAASVRFDQRFDMGRTPDVWREDPRIPLKAQISNFYYVKNQFDRGHLTRREDLEFGPKQLHALQSAADTCHYTNCVPQHEKFNRNKELWQGIERHILEGVIFNGDLNVQVLTGPILEEDDPTWDGFPKIQYPRRFWKVVAAINSQNMLVATAYILDQTDVIGEHGIAPKELIDDPFGGYKTFQVRISEVERLTQLSFKFGPDNAKKPLSQRDPLILNPPRRSRSTVRGARESLAMGIMPDDYRPLLGLEDIHID